MFDVNLIENSTLDAGLEGWAAVGECTKLSVREEEPEKVPTETINDVPKDYRASGRYILASGRAEDTDGVCKEIAGKLKPRVTYRVSGWISLGDCGGVEEESGCSHVVCVGLRVDDENLHGAAVCAEPGKWTEIKGAFRLKKSPCGAAVHVHGAPAGVDLKVMDLQVFATDRKKRFRKLRKKTDTVSARAGLDFSDCSSASYLFKTNDICVMMG